MVGNIQSSNGRSSTDFITLHLKSTNDVNKVCSLKIKKILCFKDCIDRNIKLCLNKLLVYNPMFRAISSKRSNVNIVKAP